jgi:hypothetical protein
MEEKTMMFRRLQALGEDKFRRITDEFMRGTPVSWVARLIQQEWGDCRDLEEYKLTRQLKRLYKAIWNEFFSRLEERAQRNATFKTNLTGGSKHAVLEQLVELALLEQQRMVALLEKEQRGNKILGELTTVMSDYFKLLVAIQRLRFDLGIDEYKLGMPAVKEDWDSKWQREQEVHNQIYEAGKKLEKIFKEYKVPQSPDISDITSGA